MKTLLAMMAVCLSIEAADRPTLRGRVVNAEGKGAPETTVFIYSAGPRIGASMLCPTCYADCRKRAVTDARGEFAIADLDPTLLFRLLVVNKTAKPIFVPQTDPLKGPAEIRVEARKLEFPTHQALRGRVVDDTGEPLRRAIVQFSSFTGKEANCGGNCEGVDMVSVTDEAGEFVIGAEKKFDLMSVEVEAAGFAKRRFYELSSEEKHELKLTRGAMVTGRLLIDGKPAAGVAVGMVGEDRTFEMFTGSFDTVTDSNGHFMFANLPPYKMYFVYSLMEKSVGEHALPARRVRVTGDGSRRDLGELELRKGFTLRGRLRLSDGADIPAGTEMFLGPQEAWDARMFRIGPDGAFETKGIPAGSYSLSARVKGYVFSPKNVTLDRLNGDNIVGRIDQDLFLEVLMEPGARRAPDFNVGNVLGNEAIPRHRQMQGVAPDAN